MTHNEWMAIAEVLLPVMVFLSAHIVDHGILRSWQLKMLASPKSGQRIMHYQWEFAFLISSLLVLLGLKYDAWQYWAVGVSTIVALFFIGYLSRDSNCHILPFHIGWFSYYLLMVGYCAYHYDESEPLFVGAASIVLLAFALLSIWAHRKARTPDIPDMDNITDLRILRDSRQPVRERLEAFEFICKRLKESGKSDEMDSIVREAKSLLKDYKKEIQAIFELITQP